MPAVAAMTVMHEQVHERAGEQRLPDESSQDMRAMFGKEQRTADDVEAKQYKCCS